MTNPRVELAFCLSLLLIALARCGGSGSSQLSSPTPSFQSTASLSFPYSVAVDSAGNLFVADSGNNKIRLITAAGAVTTIDGISAGLEKPVSVAVDRYDDLFVGNSNEILEIAPTRAVTTDAGSDNPGSANGPSASASFNDPAEVAVDSNGNIYVVDFGNNEIRKITPPGVVSTFAGSGAEGAADRTGTGTTFNGPYATVVDKCDFLCVTDYYNNEIREISPTGIVTTLAGSTSPGNKDGTALPRTGGK
jgi:NHL repeat-containing protein